MYHKISYRLGDFTFIYLDINAVGTPVNDIIGNSNVVLNWMDNSQYIRKRESAASIERRVETPEVINLEE